MKTKNRIFMWFLIGAFIPMGCVRNTNTEKYQTNRNSIVNVHDNVHEFSTDSILVGSVAKLFLMKDYLLIGDYRSMDNQIHIFNKNDFSYLTSTGKIGQGPDEITVLGNIGVDEAHGKFYVSDHGKMKIFSYDMDSVLRFPNYSPRIKSDMNMTRFPDKYQYISDTMSVALMIEPTSVSTFNMAVSKWNLKDGSFSPMSYQHPKITKKRISFAASMEHNLYVECYNYYDLMTICSLDGSLKCNVYGPQWSAKESNEIHYYGDVIFCGDKIVAAYSGKKNFSDDYYPTQLLVFDLEGNYLKTLDVGYRIVSLCYDKENNRILMNLDDVYQFAYVNL